jgi:ferredoxin
VKNRIYFFTGTGNSLKLARDIANALPECELVAICRDADLAASPGYDRIGFVFPVYFSGLPAMVSDFIRKAQLSTASANYYFAVAVPGASPGDSIPQARNLFQEKGLHLDFGTAARMTPNCVAMYNVSAFFKLFGRMGDKRRAKTVIRNIVLRTTNDGTASPNQKVAYTQWLDKVHAFAVDFAVNEDCVSCGTCQSVCPAKNITLENGRPVFHDRCESCMACIQHCPKRAINYKELTQKRGRYTHPDIGHETISQYYKRSE